MQMRGVADVDRIARSTQSGLSPGHGSFGDDPSGVHARTIRQRWQQVVSFARPKTRRAVARELRAARIAARLTTSELAGRLGWPQSRIAAIEGARRGVSIEEFLLIAQVLNLDLRRLLRKIVR